MLYTDGRRKPRPSMAAAGRSSGATLALDTPRGHFRCNGVSVEAITRGAVVDHASQLRAGAHGLRALAAANRHASPEWASRLSELAQQTERCAAACDRAARESASPQEILIYNARAAWLIDKDLAAAFSLVVRARRAGELSNDLAALAAPLEQRFAARGWNSVAAAAQEVPDAA